MVLNEITQFNGKYKMSSHCGVVCFSQLWMVTFIYKIVYSRLLNGVVDSYKQIIQDSWHLVVPTDLYKVQGRLYLFG